GAVRTLLRMAGRRSSGVPPTPPDRRAETPTVPTVHGMAPSPGLQQKPTARREPVRSDSELFGGFRQELALLRRRRRLFVSVPGPGLRPGSSNPCPTPPLHTLDMAGRRGRRVQLAPLRAGRCFVGTCPPRSPRGRPTVLLLPTARWLPGRRRRPTATADAGSDPTAPHPRRSALLRLRWPRQCRDPTISPAALRRRPPLVGRRSSPGRGGALRRCSSSQISAASPTRAGDVASALWPLPARRGRGRRRGRRRAWKDRRRRCSAPDGIGAVDTARWLRTTRSPPDPSVSSHTG